MRSANLESSLPLAEASNWRQAEFLLKAALAAATALSTSAYSQNNLLMYYTHYTMHYTCRSFGNVGQRFLWVKTNTIHDKTNLIKKDIFLCELHNWKNVQLCIQDSNPGFAKVFIGIQTPGITDKRIILVIERSEEGSEWLGRSNSRWEGNTAGIRQTQSWIQITGIHDITLAHKIFTEIFIKVTSGCA